MDRISGIVVLLLGAVILWQGSALEIGKVNAPGPGFFPALIAIILIFLSFLLIFSGGKKEEKRPAISRRTYGPAALVFLSLLAYYFFIEILGFIVVSFLLMASLFASVGRQRWYLALLWGLVSTGLAYLLFEVLLKSNLPAGVFGV